MHLGLRAHDGLLAGEVSVSVSASIGPVRALIDRFGVETLLAFPEHGGNVGVANLDTGLKPPDGIGLVVDATAVVTGGGVLVFDTAEHVYAGAVQLSIHELDYRQGVRAD